ncbi:PREDICTED: cation-dependent mannose-6-phosphate receptor [Gekko japonicus]|uniref:Cation-dependent mannose-6-phosphate receptor n=1 Tax=Gekko japonicus TaxID=146911 RepID=A0ABM1JVE3_GEKJA|nr:PREDICTED: cation-dependent mannose-6-phosphate receptor [Gekko japonicus]
MFLGGRMSLAHTCLPAMLLALVTTAAAGEKECDLVGVKGSESKREVALLKRLEPLANYSFTTNIENEREQYTYTFRVCRETPTGGEYSGLVQVDEKSKKTTVVGRINETHVASGTEWILLIYKGGESYGSHCGNEKRKAMVMITCNRKMLTGPFTMVAEEREKEEECFYLFEMESSVACPPVDSHLSVGSILLITFASLVAVYVIGGFLYQRLVVGAKGMEQFPHFAFWQDMGNLVADGCDFVCRSNPRNVPTAYRGVGDDQLSEEPEERDDHLLPM